MGKYYHKIRYNSIFFLLIIFILALLVRQLYSQSIKTNVFRNRLPLSGRVIVIDPGHGGVDGGSTYKDGTLEKDINLQVSLKVKKLLEREGTNVIMTRAKDIALDHLNKKSEYRHKRDLISRVDIINSIAPEIFLSIHVNAQAGSCQTSGPMVFFNLNSVEGRRAAKLIQRKLEQAYKQFGHNVKTREPVANTSLYLLCNTKYPGVIVELGFITNAKDRELLKTPEFQENVSKAIVSALEDFF